MLRSFFTDEQLTALTSQIDISAPPGLGYYPLPKPGERFPVNDPQLQPRLAPRPGSDAQFLHGYEYHLECCIFSNSSRASRDTLEVELTVLLRLRHHWLQDVGRHC